MNKNWQDALIKRVLADNEQLSHEYMSPGVTNARRLYRAKHKTAFVAFKCMDGRLNLSVITQTPVGIIQPMRNLGGRFDLGSPFLGEYLKQFVARQISDGRHIIPLVTYHFSIGDPHRGCAGFGYDTNAAREQAFILKAQIERCFDTTHQTVYPVVVGIETDFDALTFHGDKGGELSVAKLSQKLGKASEYSNGHVPLELKDTLEKLYPDMPYDMLRDLAVLATGNIRHHKKVVKDNRPIEEAVHKEYILGVGRGFDWLHRLNEALIVGPYAIDMAGPIKTAASLLASNLKDKRIEAESGVLLMASSVYRDTGSDRALAIEKSNALAHLAMDTIEMHYPELGKVMIPLVGTVDGNTRYFTRQPFERKFKETA